MKYQVETASASFIMALGIATIGAFQDLPILKGVIETVSAVLLLVCFIGLHFGYIRDGLIREFMKKHVMHPIQSFAIGTWIAAISVTILTIHLIIPMLHVVSVFLYGCNIVLLIAYLFLVVRNYVYLLIRNEIQHVLPTLNGVVLLACVSIQSMLIAGRTVFHTFLPIWCMGAILVTGVLFYCMGLMLIIWRHLVKERQFGILHWSNANCIIHGAMSITGLASVTCHIFYPTVNVWIWVWVLFCFLAVELVEVIRAVQRVRAHGWKQGLFVYHVSQWSRNFTFGMFWAFTVHLNFRGTFLQADRVFMLKSWVQHEGVYVILGLLVIEVGLFIQKQIAEWKKQTTITRDSSYPITF